MMKGAFAAMYVLDAGQAEDSPALFSVSMRDSSSLMRSILFFLYA